MKFEIHVAESFSDFEVFENCNEMVFPAQSNQQLTQYDDSFSKIMGGFTGANYASMTLYHLLQDIYCAGDDGTEKRDTESMGYEYKPIFAYPETGLTENQQSRLMLELVDVYREEEKTIRILTTSFAIVNMVRVLIASGELGTEFVNVSYYRNYTKSFIDLDSDGMLINNNRISDMFNVTEKHESILLGVAEFEDVYR